MAAAYAAWMTDTTQTRLEYYRDRIREAESAVAHAKDASNVESWKQVAAGYQYLLNRLSGNEPETPPTD